MKTTGILIFSAIFTLFLKFIFGTMLWVFLILALWICSVFAVVKISDAVLEDGPTTFEDLMEYPSVFAFGPFLGVFFICSEWHSIVEYFGKKFQHVKIQSPILIKKKQ